MYKNIYKAIILATTLSSLAVAQDVNDGHLLSDRWTSTATDGGGISLGDPVTLTWGFIDDGTSIAGNAGEPASNSSLISFLDTNLGAGAGGTDLTNRPWFSTFESSYNRWGEISGLSFAYEAADGGAALDGTSAPTGLLGSYADMRIGGHSIDGQSGSNTLAYNFYPNHGDMVIDTDNIAFFSNTSNASLGFRNVITHEIGHGLGVAHLVSNNAQFLMEPFISTSFDGPQHADILAIHRGYGDINEAGSGNDTTANATDLGILGTFAGIGLDGDNAVVAGDNVDFVSIDGSNDTDVYSITLDESGDIDVVLESLGLQYQIQEQDGNPSANVDTSAMNNLEFSLLDTDGITVIATAASAAIGQDETILGLSLTAGTYFIQVNGSDDRAQFYSITANFAANPVPELSGITLLCLSSFGFMIRRRR